MSCLGSKRLLEFSKCDVHIRLDFRFGNSETLIHFNRRKLSRWFETSICQVSTTIYPIGRWILSRRRAILRQVLCRELCETKARMMRSSCSTVEAALPIDLWTLRFHVISTETQNTNFAIIFG